MTRYKIHPDLRELLTKLAGDGLDGEDQLRLRKILTEDAASRAFYRKYMVVEASLQWQSCSILRASSIAPSIVDGPVNPCEAIFKSDGSCAAYEPLAPAEPKKTSPVLGFLGESLSQAGDFLNRPTPFWVLISAMVLVPLISLFMMVLVSSKRYDGITETQVATADRSVVPQVMPEKGRIVALQAESGRLAAERKAAKQKIAEQNKVAEPECVAYLERQSSDARWSGQRNAAIRGIGMQAGHELRLTAGLAEIAFESGATVILQSPVRFMLENKNAGALLTGKLTAHVPPQAKGFCVKSNGLAVVDLGTEFGIQTSKDSNKEVYVFDGVVEATISQEQDDVFSPLHSDEAHEQKPLRLEKGVALQIDPQAVTIRSKPIDPNRFVRRMPNSGVTNRPIVQNPSFEFPPVEELEGFNPAKGNAGHSPLVGWQGQEHFYRKKWEPNAICQLSPYVSPEGATHNMGPGATDGKQVAVLSLREDSHKYGTCLETWIFQPLGTVQPNDVGRTMVLQADVAARAGQHNIAGDGAKAAAAFAVNVSKIKIGNVVGQAGIDESVLCAEGVQTLTATLKVDRGLIGKTLFVRLSVDNANPKSGDEQYHFDNVRCQVLD